ncbi:MAG: glycosyltransferase family 2 protein [Campylobacterota bacterium]
MAEDLTPSVAIVVATYNGETYIAEQLESISQQSYKNFNVIIVDDASSDGTVAVIQSFMDKLPLKLIQNENNLGYIKNFEKALSLADADYVAPCDQDDIWTSDKLQVLVDNIDDATLVYSNSELVDAEGNSLNRTLSKKLKNNFISTRSALSFVFDNCVSAHAMLFKKELLDSIFPFPKTLYFDAWIAANAASSNGIKYIDQNLVLYRQHATNTLSITQKKPKAKMSKSEKKAKENATAINMIEELLDSPQLSKQERELIKALLNAQRQFTHAWFNLELFLLLVQHRHLFFQITTRSPLWLCFKKALGYKSYRLFPFL